MGYLELRVPSTHAPDLRTVEVRLDGEPAGAVGLRVCEQCELATVEEVRLPDGTAARALRVLVERLPQLRWTGRSEQAPEFWEALPWWQGSGTPERCGHMRGPAIPEQRATGVDAVAPAKA
ncbi:hypothetical protein [Saccharopolyspora taberi]|uniref:Uncharacterized protein n=1 Tax=Saccharopolyspora taberi TaxID=60895 RepID=A0ABN3VAG0_9PSEU